MPIIAKICFSAILAYMAVLAFASHRLLGLGVDRAESVWSYTILIGLLTITLVPAALVWTIDTP